MALGSLFAVLLSAVSAAAVLQPTPGGITIPVLRQNIVGCADGDVQNCIDESEGGPAIVDVHTDALIAPEVFQPTCTLTFTPIIKGGGDHVAFGWYNLKPDPANAGKFLKPAQEELYGMFLMPFNARTGAQLAGQLATLDLAKEQAAGRYAGGEIGFFLTGGTDFSQLKLDAVTHALTGLTLDRIFYTQHALNPGSSGASTYYQVLTWQSIKFKNSFYFGWEDRQASSNADNDFDDLVFLVSGIQCTGGGEPCDTKKDGVCKDGTEQCEKGELTCVQNIQASPEKCNALDDDCNGMVDDGDGLCDAGKVCDRGRCVPKCGTGEFRCAADLVCSDRHVCVEAACAKKDCPVGQVCHNGDCIDSCKGVTCPYAEVCRNGGCVDPCDGIMCDDGYSCVLGVCRSCACTSCQGTQVCHENVCVDSGCENQTCMAGAHCALGTCVDDCAGTKCPQGQLCDKGACVADPNAAMGGSSSSGGADNTGGSGIVIVIDPDPTPTGSGGSAGGAVDTGGTKSKAGDTADMLSSGDDPAAPKGCGCSIPGGSGRSYALFGLLLLGGLGLGRRRR